MSCRSTKSGCTISSSSRGRENVPTSSAWPRVKCAAGGRSGCGATNSASCRHTAQMTARCSSASWRTPNAPATWRSAGRCRPNVLDLNPIVPQSDQRPLDARRQGPARRCSATTGSMPSVRKQKDAMRDRIMRGWPFTPEERRVRSWNTACPMSTSMVPFAAAHIGCQMTRSARRRALSRRIRRRVGR